MIQKYSPGQVPGTDAPGIDLIFGFGGTGKTTLALSATKIAQPLFYANFDRTAAHLLKNVPCDYYYIEALRTHTKRDASAVLSDLLELRDAALAVGEGVFLLDNWAAQWDTTVLALAPDDVDTRNNRNLSEAYSDPNAWQRSFWTPLAHSNLYVIVTAPSKQLWGNYNPPRFIPDTWRHWHTVVTSVSYTFVEGQQVSTVEVPREDSFLGRYKVQILQAKKNPAVQGVVLEDPTYEAVRGLLG